MVEKIRLSFSTNRIMEFGLGDSKMLILNLARFGIGDMDGSIELRPCHTILNVYTLQSLRSTRSKSGGQPSKGRATAAAVARRIDRDTVYSFQIGPGAFHATSCYPIPSPASVGSLATVDSMSTSLLRLHPFSEDILGTQVIWRRHPFFLPSQIFSADASTRVHSPKLESRKIR